LPAAALGACFPSSPNDSQKSDFTMTNNAGKQGRAQRLFRGLLGATMLLAGLVATSCGGGGGGGSVSPACQAAKALARPAPWVLASSFRSMAVDISRCLRSAGFRPGSASSNRAAVPAAWGVAMLVPESST